MVSPVILYSNNYGLATTLGIQSHFRPFKVDFDTDQVGPFYSN